MLENATWMHPKDLRHRTSEFAWSLSRLARPLSSLCRLCVSAGESSACYNPEIGEKMPRLVCISSNQPQSSWVVLSPGCSNGVLAKYSWIGPALVMLFCSNQWITVWTSSKTSPTSCSRNMSVCRVALHRSLPMNLSGEMYTTEYLPAAILSSLWILSSILCSYSYWLQGFYFVTKGDKDKTMAFSCRVSLFTFASLQQTIGHAW